MILEHKIINNTLEANPPKKLYLTPAQLCARQPAFSLAGIRYHIFNNTNNFNACITRVGKKILICEESFLRWVESHNA